MCIRDRLKTAQGFADEGDYAGAIHLLEDATKEDERFTKQIEAYKSQYKEAVLKEAAGYAESSDFEAAVAALEKSQELLSDDADIAAKIEEYEAMYPVLLTDLSPSGGMDCATGWTASDASGNSYGSGLSFALYPVCLLYTSRATASRRSPSAKPPRASRRAAASPRFPTRSFRSSTTRRKPSSRACSSCGSIRSAPT